MQGEVEAHALEHCERHDGLLGKGQWKVDSGSSVGTVLVSCPQCGRVFPIMRYKIMSDGVVIPATTCPFRCSWSALMLLEGWKP